MRKLLYEAGNSILTRSRETFALKTWAMNAEAWGGRVGGGPFKPSLATPSKTRSATVLLSQRQPSRLALAQFSDHKQPPQFMFLI